MQAITFSKYPYRYPQLNPNLKLYLQLKLINYTLVDYISFKKNSPVTHNLETKKQLERFCFFLTSKGSAKFPNFL